MVEGCCQAGSGNGVLYGFVAGGTELQSHVMVAAAARVGFERMLNPHAC